MSVLQFGINCKDLCKSKRMSDIYSLYLDKIVVSNSIPCSKGKHQRYVVGYEDDDGEIVPLYVKRSRKVFSYEAFPYSENSAWTMGFNLEDHEQWLRGIGKCGKL